MFLLAENIDIYPDTLIDVIDNVLDIIHKDERNFEDNKRIRNILDDLDSFNLTFSINEVDMIKYSLLLSIDKISVELVDSEEVKFEEIEFEDDELNAEYNRLLKQYKTFESLVNLPDNLLQYIQPNSRLVNVRISLSIKDFVHFILTCSKYDELLDIIVMISNYDTVMEKLVTMSMSLYDLNFVDDLFIRLQVDEEYRRAMLDSGVININIMSNDEYVIHCLKNSKSDVKISTIGTCSLVAYREIVKNIPKQQIKIENFFDLINQDYMSLTFPVEYLHLDEYVSNAIDGYIYDWYLLIDKLKQKDDTELITMLCCLGCFSNIFKMNTNMENYFMLLYQSNLSEVQDLMTIFGNKLKDEECK